MRPTESMRLGQALLALCSFTAVIRAQDLSIDSDGCYWTSTVVFGNTTSLSTSMSTSSTPSTTSDEQSLSPILTFSSPSLTTTEPIALLTSTPAISPFQTTSIDPGEPLTPPTSVSPGLTSSSSLSSSASLPPPASTPFRITVSGFGSKLRARAPSYISFHEEDAYLVPDEELSAIFVLTFDGQLRTGDATVGTDSMTGSLPLMQFPGPTQPSEYRWGFNDTRLMFGDTSFSALSDGQMFVTFPGSQPPMGAVQLDLEPEFVETTSSSSITLATSTQAIMSPSSSIEAVTTPDTPTTFSSGASKTTSEPDRPISSASATASNPISPPASSLSTTHSAPMTPDSPLSSSVIVHTTAASPVLSSSTAASLVLSSTSRSPNVQSSSVLASSASSSATTMVGVSSSTPLIQRTSVQTSRTTQLSLITRSPSASPLASSSSLVAPSSAVGFPPSSSPSAGATVSSVALASSAVSSAGVSSSSSPRISTTPATRTTVSSPLPSSLPSTTSASTLSSSTIPPTSSTSVPPLTTTSQTSTITSTTSAPHSYTGPRTRSSSTSTSTISNPSLTPYPAKRGLAYGNVTTLQFYPPPSPYIAWSYDYYSLPNASDNVGPYPYPSPSYRFIPLLYNDAPSLTSIWPANVNFSISNYGSDAIFGFNEPDANFNGMSSNMPVARAVAGYGNFMQPFAGRVKIGAPAVTNAGGGLPYLQQFLGNATQQNLTIDFINIHWYASPYNIDYFKAYVTQAYNISMLYSPNLTSSYHNTRSGGVLPIWVTEFGMDQNNYNLATTVQFLKNATLWMDQQDWVERYAWFGNYPGGRTSGGSPTTNMLLNVDGSGRSALGDAWYQFNGTN